MGSSSINAPTHPSLVFSLLLHSVLAWLGCGMALAIDAHRDAAGVVYYSLGIVVLTLVGHGLYMSGEKGCGRSLSLYWMGGLVGVACIGLGLHQGALIVGWGVLAGHGLYYLVSPRVTRIVLGVLAFVFGTQLSPSAFVWLFSPRFW